jgi:ATP-dependent exoDNAse (exonuclease V) alpha subunit
MEHQWAQGRELLTPNDVLVIDEAGMIGTRQMERVLSKRRSAARRSCWSAIPSSCRRSRRARHSARSERHGSVEITEIRRQREDWQRDATRHLATGGPARRSAPMPSTDMQCMKP